MPRSSPPRHTALVDAAQIGDGHLSRKELSALVSRFWKVSDLVYGPPLPASLNTLVIACRSDDHAVSDHDFSHAVRGAVPAPEDKP